MRALRLPAPVAAIGIFDGVHRGHQAILKKAIGRARALKGTATAITFHPHPLAVLKPAQVLPLLISLEQRLKRFSEVGIRSSVVIPFTHSFSRWSPEKFTRQMLVRRFGVREVVVGRDFRFGARRRGDIQALRRLGQQLGFKVHAVAPVRSRGRKISSGMLRRLIAAGRLQQAARCLGWPVTVVGRVVEGVHRGRSLGFPTANLRVEAGVLPPPGVYAVRAASAGRVLEGVANLGFRPTFTRHPRGNPLLEVHLFGLRRALYGRRLEVAFFRKIRSERRFPSSDALQRQLIRDAVRARCVLRFWRPAKIFVAKRH